MEWYWWLLIGMVIGVILTEIVNAYLDGEDAL